MREAEKAHSLRTFSKGRGAKKKNPNCIQIRVLLWCRKRGSIRACGLSRGAALRLHRSLIHHRTLRPPSIITVKSPLTRSLWQITLRWIPLHPTLLPGVHFGIGWGAFNYRAGCKLLWGGVHFSVGGVHFQREGCILIIICNQTAFYTVLFIN